MHLGGELADVRVAAGLLHPGHEFTWDTSDRGAASAACSATEQLLRRASMLTGWISMSPDNKRLQHPSEEALALAPGQSERIQASKVAEQLAVARDALFLMALHQQLQPALQMHGLLPALECIERPMVRAIADLEWHGLPVDPLTVEEQLSSLRKVQLQLLDSWKRAATDAGICAPQEPVGANRQVKALLWEKLELRPPPNAEVRFSAAAVVACFRCGRVAHA